MSNIPKIETLVADIEGVLLKGLPQDYDEKILDEFAKDIKALIPKKFNREPWPFKLRVSNLGTPCIRQLWLDKYKPDGKEELRPEHYNKFFFGDMTEEYLILLIKLAGHKVELRQEKVDIYGVRGQWDLIVDGVLADIKSASTFSFQKFKEGLTPEKDAFAYLTQLRSYFHKAKEYPEVTDKKRAAFIVMDKQHGHIHIDFHEFKDFDLEGYIKERQAILADKDNIPDRHFKPKPDGYKHKVTKEFITNGNELLDTNCSYCAQKFNCWDNIRVFLSSNGPKFFTKVVKEPKMLEITKDQVTVIEDVA